MTIKETAMLYYPKFWDKQRIKMLFEANKLTQQEYEEIIKLTENKT